MNIVHVNTYDKGGGAEIVAMQFLDYQQSSVLVVKTASLNHQRVRELPKYRKDRFFHFVDQLMWKIGIHKKFKRIFFFEDECNDTYAKLAALSEYQMADIIHLHNLHGGYFDLTALRKIAKEKKIVWTLHDMWSMTGGEAYTFDNENYKAGIAYTPFTDQYPLRNSAIDRRQHFMDLKKKIYLEIAESIVFVPVSSWLKACFQSAYVFNQQLTTKVIHNGIDTSIFYQQGERTWSTPRLLLFNNKNPFKGTELFEQILPHLPENINITIVGNKLPFTPIQQHTYLPYITDRIELARCYNEHDILLFPSKAEALGLVPMEAMACGVCVFASAVGGIPEIVKNNDTGFLFEDAQELLPLLKMQLENIQHIRLIGKNASNYISKEFSLSRMMENYTMLYKLILNESAS